MFPFQSEVKCEWAQFCAHLVQMTTAAINLGVKGIIFQNIQPQISLETTSKINEITDVNKVLIK